MIEIVNPRNMFEIVRDDLIAEAVEHATRPYVYVAAGIPAVEQTVQVKQVSVPDTTPETIYQWPISLWA